MRAHITFVLMLAFIGQSVFTASGVSQPVQSTAFSEVEITLDENFTLSDAQTLPVAPGGDVQVLDDGRKVKAQLPQKSVRNLIDTGADVNVTRNFILMQAAADDTEPNDIAPADSSPAYGENDDNIQIPYNDWAPSDISFLSWPSELLVTTVDVHYRVYGSSGFMYLDFGDEDYDVFTYILLDYVYSGGGLLTDTVTGITDFFGKPVSQYWILWAYEQYGDGSGWIDYWWIKLYYDQPGGYCPASGGCAEYIERVQIGSIDNTSDCEYYSDYTNLSTSMQISTGYSITVTNGVTEYYTDECGIWVDWNQDEDFDDAGEQINVSSNPGVGPYTATITPPPAAVLGDTRMRIRIIDSDYDDLDACGSSSFGEVEDYTITVAEAGQSYVTISGYVRTESSDPLEGIDVSAGTGLNDTTNASGYYEIEVESPYTGTVLVITPPVLWEFSSPYIFNNLTVDAPNTNFTAIPTGPTYGGGSGTSQDPYLIFTPEHLQTLGATPQHWDKNFKLMADLDLSGYTGEEFNIIGDCSQGAFTGSFDGNEHFIYNFNYETTDNNSIGLFGCATACSITDLAMVDPVIKADNADSVGALVGTAQTVTIERCSIESGRIDGENTKGLGGFFGRGNTVFLYDSYTTVNVKASDEFGGFGGELVYGAVRRCFAAGHVEPGYGFPIYRTATIGSGQLFVVSDCFWDSEVCGTTSSLVGTGKTTDQMYRQDTFENWDFENTWKICENANYPTQAWKEFAMGDLNCSYKIDTYDLGFMCTQWLMNKLYFDIAPDGGDSFVNFLDWSTFAAAWQSSEGQQNYDIRCDVEPDGGDGKIDEGDLAVFIDEWLANGYSHLWADIFPQPDGDGVVDIYDFALFAQQWMLKY
jgi:hypothetical protein